MKLLLSILTTIFVFQTAHAVSPGSNAPDFKEKDMLGKEVSLADYKGKHIILEWFNKDCPYVRKHYDSKNMQTLQAEMTGKGIVWLTVVSSVPGKQGYETPEAAQKTATKEGNKATAVILDIDGSMGKAYGAKTTPHMYLISPEGKLLYNGAIDSNSSSDPKTIAGAKNYIKAAVESALAGKAVEQASTKPYGCSVKY